MCADKVGFTEQRVARFPAPAKGYELYWDDDAPGLGVRVTAATKKNPTGARSYVFEKRVHGETVRVTIGAAGPWKLADARKRARELTVLVDKGGDPRVVAAEQRQEHEARRAAAERQDLVVATAWARYIEANKANWGERHHADHIALAHLGGERKKKRGGKGKTKPGPLAAFMPLKLSELSAEGIAKWLEHEGKSRPTSAAQAYRLLRAFIRWANDEKDYKGLVPADAYSARSVRKAVPESSPKVGDCLKRAQLPAWFKAVRTLSNPAIRVYLQVLLLIGARREELATLRWKHVDTMWHSLKIRDKAESKGGKDGWREVPLTPYVESLLSTLPRKNEWVFSSTAEHGRMVEPRLAHNAALEAAGIPHITLHGLRRSFRTFAGSAELPSGVAAQIMGHKPSALVEKHYERREHDELLKWHTRFETWLLEQAGVVFTKPGEKAKLGVVNSDGRVQPAA